jgi:transposase
VGARRLPALSRGLEQVLLEAGERLVRVPPRLTTPARRRGRSRGKSDAIDALAVAAPPCASRGSISHGPKSRCCGS